MVAGEANQKKGYDHVKRARRWLDSTTRVKIQWDVYEFEQGMELTPVRGPVKTFDMRGVLVAEDGTHGSELWVECKGYDSAGGKQAANFREFLANCYSVTQAILDDPKRSDPGHEFMWITWHPFLVKTWTKLCTADEVKSAVTKHKNAVLGAKAIDDHVAELVANRLWLVVLSDRQEELTMSRHYLGKIRDLATQEGAA